MARGKLLQKRCKNGSRRNKKTKKCVKRLNAKAKTFSMKKSKKKRLNPKAKSFVPMNLNTMPRKTVSGVVTGIKTMGDIELKAIKAMGDAELKAIKAMPKLSNKHKNPWIAHLSAYRKAHPGVSYKKAMQEAKKTYVKKAK